MNPEEGLGNQEAMTSTGCPSSEYLGWQGTDGAAKERALTGPKLKLMALSSTTLREIHTKGKSTVLHMYTQAHAHIAKHTQ